MMEQQNKNDKNSKDKSSVSAATQAAQGNDDEEEFSASATGDLGGEAAGVVRGVSRSMVRAPLIGRLPATAPKGPPPSSIGRGILRRRVPSRRVAHVSDRVATGLDVYTSALEVEDEPKSKSPSKLWLVRARSFAWNLLRNTLLGMAVFEGYCYVIESLVPPLPSPVSVRQDTFKSDMDGIVQVDVDIDAMRRAPGRMQEDDEEYDDDTVHFGEPDEYSRATLPLHYLAGATAGCIHGLASSVIEGNPASSSMAKYTAWNTLHHSLAHAMLFGSYETIKRAILNWHDAADDDDGEEKAHRGSRAYHVMAFGVAGGIAGQIQHLASHYAEETVGLSNINSNQALHLNWRSSLRKTPPLRPFLWAFPPSAIGFIAFEYGKQFSTT